MDKCPINPLQSCAALDKANILEKRVDDLEDWQANSKEFHHKIYDWQRQEIDRKARIEEQLKTLNSNVAELLAYQKSQQAKPSNFLDNLKYNSVWAVVGAFILFVLAKIGI